MMPLNKPLLTLCITMLALTGCQVKDLWLGEDDEEALPGRRLAVLAEAQIDALEPEIEADAVTSPDASGRVSWSQYGGSHSNHISMAKAPWPLKKEGSESIGESWDYPYAPQPVVAGGKIFVMDAIGSVHAYDVHDQSRPVWSYEARQDDRQFLGGGLALAGGTLIVAYPTGEVLALQAVDGNVEWSRRLSSPMRAAPKVARGVVLLQTVQSQLVALDIEDGSVKWTHRGIGGDLQPMERVTPAIYVDNSVALAIVAYGSGDITALTLTSGRELWQYAMSDAPTRAFVGRNRAAASALATPPVIYRNFAFLASRQGRVVALDLSKGISFWERGLPEIRSSYLAETLWAMYLQDGRVAMLHAVDGRVLWAKEVGEGLDGPWLVNNELWLSDRDGTLLRYDALSGSELSTARIPSDNATPPLFLEDAVFWVTQNGRLHRYGGE